MKAIKRPRGAQPGNTNAVRHPYRVFLKRGTLSPEDRWVASYLQNVYLPGLRSDKPNCSASQSFLMENAAMAKGAILMILKECGTHGFTSVEDGHVTLQPAAKDLPRLLTEERCTLQAIGLERGQKPVLSPTDYWASRCAEVEATEAATGEAQDTPEIEADSRPAPVDDLAPAALLPAEVRRVGEAAPVLPSETPAAAPVLPPADLQPIEASPEPPSWRDDRPSSIATRMGEARSRRVRLWSPR